MCAIVSRIVFLCCSFPQSAVIDHQRLSLQRFPVCFAAWGYLCLYRVAGVTCNLGARLFLISNLIRAEADVRMLTTGHGRVLAGF